MSTVAPLLRRFLYISRLSPGLRHDAVAQILRQSREHNRSHGIGGALLFDGERFCQFIEGEPGAVGELVAQIELDSRHVDVRVLEDNTDASARRMAYWVSGYCESDALDALDTEPPPEPDAATSAFLALLADCDTSR